MQYFDGIDPLKFEGQSSANDLAFRHYDPAEVFMGKTMAEHLRFAVCYWHNFVWEGSDVFGHDSFPRAWNALADSDPMKAAKAKTDAAFELFQVLGVPFYCFHDIDARPEGATFAQSDRNLSEIVDYMQGKQEATGMKLLWGTANLFSHPRFMAGAASNPDPEVWAYSAATVASCMDATKQLGGENYVLWGGREGYETLLNTDLSREMDQMGRFFAKVIDYKHKIGFKGTILIEPKPQEPTKHQYDYDVATVYGFLKRYGLENEVRVNIEQGHAILAGHTFEHEIAVAQSLGIFGSIDMNRNDYQSGWDTDQFPNNTPEMALAYYEILKGGGFTTGGTNFDAKLRRQSIDLSDLVMAHAGAMDCCARGLKAAAAMLEERPLSDFVDQRYAGWSGDLAAEICADAVSLSDIRGMVTDRDINPKPVSGRQEHLENVVNRYV
jgi:xylose isomerase